MGRPTNTCASTPSLRHEASGKARDPKISWFVGKDVQPVPLIEISPIYRLRYSHEHGYRFDKQELLWDIPRLSTTEQTERWTQVVARSRAAARRQEKASQ